MKRRNKLRTIAIAIILLMAVSTSFAQRGQGKRGMGFNDRPASNQQCMKMIPDLTEEQESKMEDIRLNHMKEMTSNRNLLNEKRAKLRTLQTQDNPEMDAINKVIEEMGEIRTKMQKNKAAHHQEIRSLLTEEQKVYFDNHLMKREKRGRHSRGTGQFNCPRGNYRGK